MVAARLAAGGAWLAGIRTTSARSAVFPNRGITLQLPPAVRQVIDRVLFRLDELVRPYVHKILVVIEPLLIDEDYYARVEGRWVVGRGVMGGDGWRVWDGGGGLWSTHPLSGTRINARTAGPLPPT